METFFYLGSMALFTAFLTAVIYLFICGLIINGIYIVTRGETIIAPDGSKKDINDMVFYPLLKWVIQKKGEYYIKFEGNQLLKLCSDLQKRFPNAPALRMSLNRKHVIIEGGGQMNPMALYDAWNIWTNEYLESKDIIVKYFSATEYHVSFSLVEVYPVYRFSKYFRKPTLQCIKCMASFWGTLFFWPAAISFYGFDQIEFIIWILFCLALSWVNTFLYNKL